MKKIIVNSTEGGADIKGTIKMSLKNTIEKYCQNPIDKSKIKPLLTKADDGDKLIEKVIPLLKKDIDNLEEIIKNSRKGMAVSHGLKILMARPEYKVLLPKTKRKLFDKFNRDSIKKAQGNPSIQTHFFFQTAISKLKKSRLKNIIIMANKNFLFSEAAHLSATRNPLVNVAIYGASRAIKTRTLEVEGGINHFLTDKKDAITRTNRNIIILKAAYTAAKNLKKSYKKTLNLLKKYNTTKDEKLLTSVKKEPINLKDAEDYFKEGNWAHPLLDSQKYMGQEICGVKKYDLACQIHLKALDMRNSAIQKAKENEIEHHDKMVELIKYNELIKQAKIEGGINQDFKKALKLMRKAIKLLPEEPQAQWGLATALHHSGNIKESLKEYKKLINKHPDRHKFRFEYGKVLLRDNQMQLGLKEIGKVMEKTEEYDNFLMRLGELYEEINLTKEALSAYTSYLKKYPFDFNAWMKKGCCLLSLNKKREASSAYQKALDIKPDLLEKIEQLQKINP